MGAGNTVYQQPQAQQAVKQAQEGTMEIWRLSFFSSQFSLHGYLTVFLVLFSLSLLYKAKESFSLSLSFSFETGAYITDFSHLSIKLDCFIQDYLK